MNIEWKYVKPLHDKNSVQFFLKQNNIVLPSHIVTVIEKYNGGRPSDKLIKTADGREHVFKSLLSYNDDDLETVYDIYPLFKNTSYYPLASDPAGNFICYDVKTEHCYFYNHEIDTYIEILSIAAFDY